MKPKILILNGSLGGESGNTGALVKLFSTLLESKAEVRSLALRSESFDRLRTQLEWSDGYVFATGTYWDSWGSPLQIFLEEATSSEASSIWLGKPAAVLVTMHSVGGKGVLSRLQGVLNTLGCTLPPMSGIVYSLANQLALPSAGKHRSDLWQPEDLETIAHNLLVASQKRLAWESWAVDKEDPRRKWISD